MQKREGEKHEQEAQKTLLMQKISSTSHPLSELEVSIYVCAPQKGNLLASFSR
jgi:hypothetical protein